MKLLQFKVQSNFSHRFLRLEEEGSERHWKEWWRARSSLERRLIAVLLSWICCTSLVIIIAALINIFDNKPLIFDEEICLTPTCVSTAAAILTSIDYSADPCDDFYQYACGGWLNNNPVPDGKPTWGTFDKLWQDNQLVMKAILEESYNASDVSTGDAEQKAKIYYHSCLDLNEKIEKLGAKPLLDLINEFGGWNITGNFTVSSWNLQPVLEKLHNKYSMGGLFTWTVSEDDRNSSVYVIQIDQGGLTLPTRDHYINKTGSDPIIAAYLEYMTKVGTLLGGSEPEVKEQMKDIIAFETQLAQITMPSSERRDEEKLYHSMAIGELEFIAPFISWPDYFSHAFSFVNKSISVNQSVVVYAPNYLRDLTRLVSDYMATDGGKAQLQNYLMWQVVKSFISTLPKSFRDAGKILRKALLGTDYTEEVWRYCVGDTNSILGFAVGSLFVRKTFHEESKQIAEEMIRSVRDAFIGNFPSLTWMDEKTRDAAKEKAIAITSMIGFPDFILNKDKLDEYYKDLHVIESEYFKNTLRSNQFSQRQNLKNLGEPVNKTEWGMPPATVNAYYTPNKNQIVFPAGILQKPFFDVTAPPSLNFGGMGVVVGHELTHAFDDQGREFDKNGDMKPWWNNETITKFQQRADCIADQYSSYSVNDEMVSGKQTIGENIADNGGLKAAFHAYQRWVKRMDIQERKLPGLNFTAPQLFFLSFAQVWCSSSTKQASHLQILEDPHSPSQIRVRGSLSNLPEFSETFNCKKGSTMNPPEKCEVW
ncbi:endothelin-converting enzyme homolog isoform X2 [Artemia franciscana]|uniref:endothelin-converting enzyme homolog isoform X2 n=1 Tax=Artemia franciscana TaxID=6661 RepID=UPI0032DAFDEE